jgi:GDP/UDP-N,N'-diacetylbacillosamine 2-epimerase (hydrolysing)
MTEKKRICVVTGTRAEYGLLRPVMEAIRRHPRLTLQVVAAGMHLDRRFGYSLGEIKRIFRVDAVAPMLPASDSPSDMALVLGKGIEKMVLAFRKLDPDIVLILGDRTEPLAAALAASHMNIAIAHIHGGDRTKGGIDESSRHAITKLAHIHFPASAQSRRRIVKMGENPKFVFNAGSPAVDGIRLAKKFSAAQLARKLGIGFCSPPILVVQHPVTTQSWLAGRQMQETLDAVAEFPGDRVVVYPNSDAGSRAIIRVIEKFAHGHGLAVFPNIEHDAYLSLLRHSAVLVGNSSSGVTEASYFRVPVVNIGIRQEGRERGCNVIDVDHAKSRIESAIRRAMSPEFRKRVRKCGCPYGDGRAVEKIVRELANITIDNKLIQKQIAY